MSLDLREFDPLTDSDQYRDLFVLSFPETKNTSVSTDAHYRWKFRSFPARPTAYEFVALSGGRLIGYYAALPYRYFVQGRERFCGMVCDVMTHPAARGQGVFTRLGRFATETLAGKGIDFVSGYPIRPEVIPGHLKVGWFVAFREPVYVRPLRADALLKNRTWLTPFVWIINGGLQFCNFMANLGTRRDYRVDVLSRDQFLSDAGYDEFISQWASEQRNYLVKSREFLAWRTGAPDANYQFVKLSIGGAWAGLVITRPTTLQGIPALAILDFMVPRAHRCALRTLHRALWTLARQEDREVVGTMMSPVLASTYRLASSFYLRTPAVFSIIFKALSPEMQREALGAAADWHLTWIDSDDL